MVRTLFNICLSAVCQHELSDDLALMPGECKQRLLEFFASHDQLSTTDCERLLSSRYFSCNLTQLSFFLCDDLTDDLLTAMTKNNKKLERIVLVECSKISDQGIRNATRGQKHLQLLELRAIRQLTDAGLEEVKSPYLHTLDLSGCNKITSGGLRDILSFHPYIGFLFLNHCRALDDFALYYISPFLGDRLRTLELDFPSNMTDPATALAHLSEQCPNLRQLSLARFFNEADESPPSPTAPFKIDGSNLQDVDLYANFFTTLPTLPEGVTTLRLSVNGDENSAELVESLASKPHLRSINLQLSIRESSIQAVDNANNLLSRILRVLGDKITILQVSVPRLFDEALTLILKNTPNLTHLALDVIHLNTYILQRYFAGGYTFNASRLRSLKICKMRITYRILFAIARGARNLVELETSHMYSVDDRFVSLLGDNCHQLQTVNFNGCRYVSDKGLANLARRCPLREVRIRGTACTDKSLYLLAQFCPELEWISHADFSGRPKFTDVALQCLRDSCISRVIC